MNFFVYFKKEIGNFEKKKWFQARRNFEHRGKSKFDRNDEIINEIKKRAQIWRESSAPTSSIFSVFGSKHISVYNFILRCKLVIKAYDWSKVIAVVKNDLFDCVNYLQLKYKESLIIMLNHQSFNAYFYSNSMKKFVFLWYKLRLRSKLMRKKFQQKK